VPKSAFVIMPIGEQVFANVVVSESDLRDRYNHLIKEALLQAYPEIDVIRADEIAAPGVITTDILTNIMHADIIVADVTYPNPNVFYELGLCHAARANGTIIIRESGVDSPFDIAHLRHIEYQNTPAGLKKLSERLKSSISLIENKPELLGNSFQEIAKLRSFQFPIYAQGEEANPMMTALLAVMRKPQLLSAMTKSSSGEAADPAELLSLLAEDPETASIIMNALQKTGQLDFGLGESSSSKLGFGASSESKKRIAPSRVAKKK
jgi:hypothetical protein